MAEMTASEAREVLLNLSWAVGAERRSQIAALIERQDQEITRLEGQHVFDNSQIVEYEGIVRVQAAKIERQEKMLAMAIARISLECCPMDRSYNLACREWTEDGTGCEACWRKWLEEAGE